MISLQAGAEVRGAYESQVSGSGRGVLYVLNTGLAFEAGDGSVLELAFSGMVSFSATRKDRLRVVQMTGSGPRSVEFKVRGAREVESRMAEANRVSAPGVGAPADLFDQDAHSEAEARWFEANWDDIMRFVRPERAAYLGEYVDTIRVGSPDADPYLIMTDYENLSWKDFADINGFLRWRYGDMTEKEAGMISGVFRDFEEFSVSMLEMDVQMCMPRDYKKKGFTFYQFVAIVAREKCESVRVDEANKLKLKTAET